MESIKNLFCGKITFFLLSITLIIGFFFNEDSAGSGGFVADFNNTWHYVLSLKENLLEGSGRIIMLPLHYIILSRFIIQIINSLNNFNPTALALNTIYIKYLNL